MKGRREEDRLLPGGQRSRLPGRGQRHGQDPRGRRRYRLDHRRKPGRDAGRPVTPRRRLHTRPPGGETRGAPAAMTVPPQGPPVKRVHLIGICGTGDGDRSPASWPTPATTCADRTRRLSPHRATMLRDKGIRVLEGVPGGPPRRPARPGRDRQYSHEVEPRGGRGDRARPSLRQNAAGDRKTVPGRAAFDRGGGTHGKTTTAGIMAWTLTSAGRDPSFLVGGGAEELRPLLRSRAGGRSSSSRGTSTRRRSSTRARSSCTTGPRA